MLDDHHRRRAVAEFAHQFKRGVGIVQIIVGQFLALNLLVVGKRSTGCKSRKIKCCLLMRIFAVAERLPKFERHGQALGEHLLLVGKSKPAGDRRIIFSRRGISLCRHRPAKRQAGRSTFFLQLGNQQVIIRRVGNDYHRVVVFCRTAHHRRATDVDILDNLCARRPFGNGRCKRVEIDHHQIDGADAMRLHRRHMLGIIANRQQPAVNRRVQCLHPSIHHLGKAGQFADVLHLQPCCAQRFRRAAG